MKKNMGKFKVVLITILSICMLTACGNVTEINEETPEANAENVVTEEVVTEEEVTEEVVSDDSVVTPDYEKLVDLESKNLIFVDVYNEVAALAVANGWEADELLVEELYTADTFILLNNSVITDPTNITNEDVEELISVTEEMTVELDTNTRTKVSVVYTAAE